MLTAIFLYIILGATDDRAPKGFAPIAIGLGLTLIHLVSIPVTNTSVNPARSLGVAWFAGGAALAQVWLFIVAPIIGAAIAGISYAHHRREPTRSTKASPTTRRHPHPPNPNRAHLRVGVRRLGATSTCERGGAKAGSGHPRHGASQRHSAEGGTRTLTPEGTGT